MAEMILPGTFIEVRPEGLIVPGRVSVNNLGVIGTAARGSVNEPVLLGSYTEAQAEFGEYDAWDPENEGSELSLVRALEQAFTHGSSTVWALRIANEDTLATSNLVLSSASGENCTLTANSPGSWGNDIAVAIVEGTGEVEVTVTAGTIEEIYTVTTGQELVDAITDTSALLEAEAGANIAEIPSALPEANLAGGNDGVAGADYIAGMNRILNLNAHIIVLGGQNHTNMGADLAAHCKVASNDENKRERVGVIGTALGEELADITGHSLDSDRVILVAPGISTFDSALRDAVTLPGSYTAAAIAGLMSSYSPHVSLTNKPLPVRDLEETFTNAELKQLVQNRVLALQEKFGFKIVKGITTSTNSAWHQITTRRIVDFAKFGVRSAADPYIGLLNNERVRGAMRATINSFLAEMVEDEMLVSYELDVAATRDEERKGIARVTIVLRPTFSIDFIKVTMFLE